MQCGFDRGVGNLLRWSRRRSCADHVDIAEMRAMLPKIWLLGWRNFARSVAPYQPRTREIVNSINKELIENSFSAD